MKCKIINCKREVEHNWTGYCTECYREKEQLNQPKTEDHAHHTNCPLEKK